MMTPKPPSLHAQSLTVMRAIVVMLEMMTPKERALFDECNDVRFISQLDQFAAQADDLMVRMSRR